MRKLLAFFFLLVLLLPALAKVWVHVDFRAHRAYIAEVLCINKDKPELDCEGLCYLNRALQQLNEQEGETRPDAKPPVQFERLLLFAQGEAAFISAPAPHPAAPFVRYTCQPYASPGRLAPFHPPEVYGAASALLA